MGDLGVFNRGTGARFCKNVTAYSRRVRVYLEKKTKEIIMIYIVYYVSKEDLSQYGLEQ